MHIDDILVIYGNDIAAMAFALAREADLASMIGENKDKKIGIKPNLVVPKPASYGATTHVEIAAGIVLYLQKNGFNNIFILEGSGVGDSTSRAFLECGYNELSQGTGVRLVDTKTDKSSVYDCKGMKLEICESALDMDFMINLPVMKGHCQTKMSCALKNNKGLIPDSEKRRFHTIGLHKPIAHLNTVIRNDFIVVDNICGDPDYELGGNPVYAGRLYASKDPVLCDAWTAAQMGYSLADIPYIELAQKLDIGSADLSRVKVRELNRASTEPNPSYSRSGKIKQLDSYIQEENACSTCYASLIYALSHIDKRSLKYLKDKICIGQGFLRKTGNIGVGKCCAGFKYSFPACPPSGAEILQFLKETI
jgi:uncharacterized protein (DUF362 family)